MIAEFDKDLTKPVWIAENKPVQGRFLVTLDLGLGAVDPKVADAYKEALQSLNKSATARQDLSQYIWIYTSALSLEEMFQTLVHSFGSTHHNYSAIDLTCGEGLAYNAKRRVVYEIEAGAQ
jgi:hypothetical protein